MLESLKINNYALIQELDISFEKGFSTLTGETGAGKSILLGALGLALGKRADINSLRNNEKKCVIEACFNIGDFNLKSVFSTLDIDYEDTTIIRREITPSGKSRSFINDTPVNLNDLKTLSERLIDIHSQHENLALNNSLFQMSVLDAISKNSSTLNLYKKTYNQFNKLKKELLQLEEKANLASSEADYIQFQFNQLNDIKLENINQEELEQELELLNHAEDIQLNLSSAFSLLTNNDINAIDQLKQAKQSFEKIQEFYPEAKELVQRINSCIIELQDISSETETGAESIEYNPERVIVLKEQLDKLYSLFQKHQVESIAELIRLRNSLEESILEDESYAVNIEKIKVALKIEENKLEDLSKQLTESREKAISKLINNITTLLSELGIPNAVFNIELTPTQDFTPSGKNHICFLFSANKSHAPQNLSKVASGGEISRLMLSIKYILSQSVALPTIIFDEIDTGVSGEIAHKMANIMQNMSGNMQVISITHLPQIAAKGQSHYRVYKHDVNSHTETKITKLDNNQRINEVAKMLSGEDITQQAIENAKSLIAQ